MRSSERPSSSCQTSVNKYREWCAGQQQCNLRAIKIIFDPIKPCWTKLNWVKRDEMRYDETGRAAEIRSYGCGRGRGVSRKTNKQAACVR